MTHFLLFDFDCYCQYCSWTRRFADNVSVVQRAQYMLYYINNALFSPNRGITRSGFYDKHLHTLTIFACPTRHHCWWFDTPTHKHTYICIYINTTSYVRRKKLRENSNIEYNRIEKFLPPETTATATDRFDTGGYSIHIHTVQHTYYIYVLRIYIGILYNIY